MAFQTGQFRIRGRLYDITGLDSYTHASSVDYGKVDSGIQVKIERHVTRYTKHSTGSTPRFSSIDGETVMFTISLTDYNSDTMNLISQRRKPTGAVNNFHFGLGASYPLGRLLSTSEYLSLIIRDSTTPADYPALYIPRAVVLSVESFAIGMDEKMMPSAIITVGADYDPDLGSVGCLGNIAGFPAL